MIEEVVRVVEVRGSRARVEPLVSPCDGCAVACGTLLRRASTCWVRAPIGVSVGEKLLLQLPSGWVARAGMGAYGVPLLAMLAGLVIGGAAGAPWASDAAAAIGAVIGLTLSLSFTAKLTLPDVPVIACSRV